MYLNTRQKVFLWSALGVAFLLLLVAAVPGLPGGKAEPGRKPLAGDSVADVPVYRMLGALCLLAGLLYGLYWLARRWAGNRAGAKAPGLFIEERLPVGDRCRLLVVVWQGRKYLVGQSPGGFALLDQADGDPAGTGALPGADEAGARTAPGSRSTGFAATLESLVAGWKRKAK